MVFWAGSQKGAQTKGLTPKGRPDWFGALSANANDDVHRVWWPPCDGI